LQELEETGYWLELLVDSRTVSAKQLAELRAETDELTKIFASVAIAAKKNR